MRRLVVAVVLLVGCYKDPSFHDCEIACTDSCPGGLSCVLGGCRDPGQTTACSVIGGGDAAIDGAGSGSAGDRDGDGIADGSDNCPAVPNPDQNDEDRDGKGDPCDPCPIGFSATEDADDDGDGVGNGCDPAPNDAANPNHMVFFSGFKTAPAMITTSGQWTFNGTAMTAMADNGDARLLVDVGAFPDAQITTQVTVTATHATPTFAGTVDRGDSSLGIACANELDANANLLLVIHDFGPGVTANSASSSTWSTNTPYALQESGVNGSWQCGRPGYTTLANSPDTGTKRGIIVRSADARFDYLMIVSMP